MEANIIPLSIFFLHFFYAVSFTVCCQFCWGKTQYYYCSDPLIILYLVSFSSLPPSSPHFSSFPAHTLILGVIVPYPHWPHLMTFSRIKQNYSDRHTVDMHVHLNTHKHTLLLFHACTRQWAPDNLIIYCSRREICLEYLYIFSCDTWTCTDCGNK